jgi:hypothetical protein
MAKADKTCATTSRGCGSIETGRFVGSRLLERFELAVQQASGHEMLMTSGNAPRDQCLIPPEVQ